MSREFELLVKTMEKIDAVLAENPQAQAVVDDGYDEATCQQCHEEARDRDDSPWCLNCRIVAQEYDQERKEDR